MSQSQPVFTPAERIRELSEINNDVPTLLLSAGKAINALTNRPLHGDEENGSSGATLSTSVQEHKDVFVDNAKAYFTAAQSIMARLRRQAYALEEAGIIAADAPTLSAPGAAEASQRTGAAQAPGFSRGGAPGRGPMAPQRQSADDGDRITNGGLGNLDVGLLNSRGNSVGLEKEAELMAEAKELLEEIGTKSGQPEG